MWMDVNACHAAAAKSILDRAPHTQSLGRPRTERRAALQRPSVAPREPSQRSRRSRARRPVRVDCLLCLAANRETDAAPCCFLLPRAYLQGLSQVSLFFLHFGKGGARQHTLGIVLTQTWHNKILSGSARVEALAWGFRLSESTKATSQTLRSVLGSSNNNNNNG